MDLHRVWNPAAYQGGSVSRRYFEGWYFKQVDASEQHIVSVIPGVAYSADGTSSHSFVQVVPSTGDAAHYFAYPADAFRSEPDEPFTIHVGPSTFSCSGMVLDLKDGAHEVHGDVRFGPLTPWPVTALSPGIMGWYRFVPRMETYHGVLSMDHAVSGSLVIDGDRIDLDGGRGYIEKDWGRSFPSSWIWAQTNHFERPGVSLMLSVAKIPWMTGAFVGSIAGLYLDGDLHRFATYTGAKLISLSHAPGGVEFVLQDRRHRIEVGASGAVPGVLRSPVLGQMVGQVEESLRGTVRVRLTERATGREVFAGEGRSSGIELMDPAGDLAT